MSRGSDSNFTLSEARTVLSTELESGMIKLPQRRYLPMTRVNAYFCRTRSDKGKKRPTPNNKYGRKGKLRCAPCRNRRIAVSYYILYCSDSSVYTPQSQTLA